MRLSQDFRIVASVTTLMYHGTNIKNKGIILSQGLIPRPKTRKWKDDPHASFYQPSRESLGGIYLTNNIITATSSGTVSGGGGQCILVVVSVQTGTLLADEDDFKYWLNSIKIPGLVTNEWMIQRLYAGSVALKKGRITRDRERQEVREELEKVQDHFMASFLQGIDSKIKRPWPKQEIEAAVELMNQGFFIALKRLASHVESRDWGYERLWGVERPNAGEAEADFKRLEDRLTRVLKRVGRPEHRTSDFNNSARIETPIGYSGKNRIVAVIEVIPYQAGSGIPQQVKILYPPSGEVPAKVIADWEQREGPWNPITNQEVAASVSRFRN